MATAFDNLPRAAFMGIEFPVKAMRVRGGLRYHVHEYPHVGGGDLEKLGRRLYEVEAQVTFQTISNAAGVAGFGAWGPIWPGRLALLRSVFEREETGTLIIPSIGAMRAACIDWDQELTAKMRSGEDATFKFIEDQEQAFAMMNMVSLDISSLSRNVEVFETKADDHGFPRTLTDELLGAVNAVLAIYDQADLAQMLIASKIGMVAALCKEFDSRVDAFKDPANWEVLEAMKDLWASAQALADNNEEAVAFGAYRVPVLMTISEVATAIYGSTERSVELLQLNPIENAFEVKPETRVRYVLDETVKLAA